MKSTMTLVVVCVMTLLACGCSGGTIHRLDTTDVPVLSLDNASDQLHAWRDAGQERSRFIIEVDAGRTVPLEIHMDTAFVRVKGDEVEMTFAHDAQLFFDGKGAYVSPDGSRWAAMGDLRAMKKLFGVKQGRFAFGFGVSKAKGPHATIHVVTE